MCYAVENFYKSLNFLRWNFQFKGVFFIRNFKEISGFLKKNWTLLNPFFYSKKSLGVNISFFQRFFSKQLRNLYQKITKKNSLPLLSNLTKSLLYWSLLWTNSLLISLKTTETLPYLTLTVHYYTGLKVFKAFSRALVYSKTLLSFLILLVNNWGGSGTLKFSQVLFLPSAGPLLLLPFYNLYFFKIYSF